MSAEFWMFVALILYLIARYFADAERDRLADARAAEAEARHVELKLWMLRLLLSMGDRK